jgi:hypothetical protein
MRWLLAKDLRILRRSSLLCGLLIIYPIVLSLMIGFALSSPPSKPTVAVADEVPAGHTTVRLGGSTIDVGSYASGLLRSVTPLRARGRAAAIADVRSGRALAAVVIPAQLPEQIEQLVTQGIGNPTVEVYVNARNPLEREFVQSALSSRIAEVQSEVSRRVLAVAIHDLEQVLDGGSVALLGHSVRLLGLRDTAAIVKGAVATLPARSPLRISLGQVQDFAQLAIAGLGFAKPVLGSIGSPLTISETQLDGSTTPTDVYAAAISVTVSLMIVAMLLAAGMLALERTEHTWERLVRGLVSPGQLLGEKALLSGVCAALLSLAMAGCLSAFVTLDGARFGLWAAAAVLAAAAFAALGVAIGAVAREVSAASLMAFLVSLPVAFVALVPGTAVSGTVHTVLDVIAFCFPFKPALGALSNALGGSGPAIAPALGHLAVQALVYLALARVAARRFATG